jgi:hypothetical protein
MKIELKEITVGELAEGYKDNEEGGVVGYSGQLDIRPAYQREFIYKDKQRDAVIDTITKGFPLNVMYWAVRDEGGFEIIDGQQRTISVCQYVEGDFAFKDRYFHNLQKDEQDRLLGYKLMVYLCSGTDSERLEWFKTINIAGEELTDQELRNAVYSGSWVSDAKRYFSRTGCPAYGLSSDYMKGTPIRQDYLETAIKWINDGEIEQYMAINQHKPEAKELWLYFQKVIAWVKATFTTLRKKEMNGLPWGEFYNEFKDAELDAGEIEEQIAKLMTDDDVTRRKGIYAYVLTGDERHLSIRQFSDNDKRAAYERQKGLCANKTRCLTPGNSDGKKVFDIAEMDADHITPWSKGGKTEVANCQMLCLPCNRQKGAM